MLRRRPAPVYELFSEDELLERDSQRVDPVADEHAGHADDELGGRLFADSAQRSEARPAVAVVGHTRADRRWTLVSALIAAAVVGFSVWELLGLAAGPQQRTALAVPQLVRLGGSEPRSARTRGRQAPPAVRRRSAVARVRGRRGDAPRRAIHGAFHNAEQQAGRPPIAGVGRPATPAAAPLSHATTLTTPPGATVLADREFGFER